MAVQSSIQVKSGTDHNITEWLRGRTMSIYLVRHDKDDEGFRGGWSQRGLIAEGIEQSKKLGQYLKAHNNLYNIHRVVSSDLSRAVETATEIASELSLPLESSSNWREMNNGLIAGMAHELVEEQYPGLYFRLCGWMRNSRAGRVRLIFSPVYRQPLRSYARSSSSTRGRRTF